MTVCPVEPPLAPAADGGGSPPRAASLPARLAACVGWRRWLWAMGLGAVATLAFPPLNLVPVLWLSLPALLWLMDGAATRAQAFWIGAAFAFGHFIAGLYWVGSALLVDPRFWALIPVAVTGLPALLAVFYGAGTLAWFCVVRRFALPPVPRALLMAVVWCVVEYARGHVLTGFPWNLMGYVWVGLPGVAQAAALVGVYGVSLLTVLAAFSLAPVFQSAAIPLAAPLPGESAFSRWRPALLGLLPLLAAGVWGVARVPTGPAPLVPGITVRLVQPNIPESAKWDQDRAIAHVRDLMRLSLAPKADGTLADFSAVIWPETAVPYYIEEEPELRQALARVLPPGALLLTGAPRMTRDGGTDTYWNSLVVMNAGGTILAHYDKAHLVPFGEYVPLRRWLPLKAVAAVAPSTANLGFGEGARTLDLPGLPPVSPAICYEIIFPGDVVARTGPRPDWLLTITNDGWFGITAGPHQHFAIARLRAVEEGLPLVRAANTGISGVVDPYGRVLGRLDLGRQGVLDLPLPRPLASPTPYSHWGDLPFWLLLLGLSGVISLFIYRLYHQSKR